MGWICAQTDAAMGTTKFGTGRSLVKTIERPKIDDCLINHGREKKQE
jgi:hypothetical protein